MSERFDDITGQLSPDDLAAAQAAEVDRQLTELSHVEALTQTAGWEILKRDWLVAIELHTQKLIDLEDEKEIRKTQAAIRAYSNVLGDVYSRLDSLSTLRKERQDRSNQGPG